MKEGDDLHKIGDLINRLADELGSTDILIQINAVEMFADGASQLVFCLLKSIWRKVLAPFYLFYYL